MEFTFDISPWEQWLQSLSRGQTVSCLKVLTLLEDEDEQAAQEALEQLTLLGVTLQVDLPMYSGKGEVATRLSLEQKLQKKELLTQLEATDPLRLFVEELAQTPAAGDPQVLALEYAEGHEAAAGQLTTLMLSRVVDEALSMTGRGVLLMDLIQEGSMGLWQSILQFEEGEFESQAIWWIRQYLARAVLLQAKADGVGQRLLTAMEDYRSVYDRLVAETGLNPTPEQLAEALHMRPDEVAAVAEMLETARTMEYLKPREPEPETEEAEQAVEDTAYFQMRQRISELLSSLTEKEAKLLSLRYGLEGGLPLRSGEAGAKLGLTAEEATALEAQALSKLRKQ